MSDLNELIPLRSVWAAQKDEEWLGRVTKAEYRQRIVITRAEWHGVTTLTEGMHGVGYMSLDHLLDNYYMVCESCHIQFTETYRVP